MARAGAPDVRGGSKDGSRVWVEMQVVSEAAMASADDRDWPLPSPFLIEVSVRPEQIDAFGHVNNVVYLGWFEVCAWAHSAAVGLPIEACTALRRGMAVRRSEVDYRRAAMAGDRLTVANWVVHVDRLTARRRFQLVRQGSGELLAEALIHYVCINLDTGAPARLPPEFLAGYRVEPEVAGALGRSS